MPKRERYAELRFAARSGGSNYLYLSAYGRSMWRAKVGKLFG